MTIIEALQDINTLVYYIKNNTLDSIIFEMVARFNLDINSLIKTPMGGYNKDKTVGTYFYCIKDLKENINEYVELYNYLSDDISKYTLFNLMRYRLTTDMSFIKLVYAGIDNQYFDKNIINFSKDEVFVDCGGYTGDTVSQFISTYKNYKMIYVYEPEENNYKKLVVNTSNFKNINAINKGVSESSKTVYYKSEDGASSISLIPTDTYIETVSLDEDIKEDIGFIKMDIECEEKNAILGAKNHIKKYPKLAIALYHLVPDLWEIPKLIMSINSKYDFLIRQYREDVPWETVLYALPKS